MLGFSKFANWFTSARSLDNELDAKIRQAEALVKEEWEVVLGRIKALEDEVFHKAAPPPAPEPPPPAA